MLSIRSLAIATVAATALGLAGCYGYSTTGVAYSYPSGAVSVGAIYDPYAPYGIEYYPRYPYGGSYAYLVGSRWYVRYGTGWGYLPHEPYPLYSYRVQRYNPYVYQAPPAYRVPTPYVAPPPYRPAPYAAPPAYRPGPPAFSPAPIPAPAPRIAPPSTYHLPPSAPPPTLRAPPAR